ncbi:MAG: PAS domain S-box protein [Kangiellaceae bacterium]|nr:PAS domain S-box protein [Kangiellaceae bacterium]
MDMWHLEFLDSTRQVSDALQGSYSIVLVILSVIIALFAIFIAFLFLQEMHETQESQFQRKTLFLAGVVSVGGGIWVMHFVGMLAYKLPTEIFYDLPTTLISIIPALMAGIVIFSSKQQQSDVPMVIRSVLMGVAIGTMHYVGMMAMRLDAQMVYSPSIFTLSIVLAVALSYLSLEFKRLYTGSSIGKNKKRSIFIAAIIMSFAVSGMHYIGMSAVYFFPHSEMSESFSNIEPKTLLLVVIVVMLFMFVCSMFAVYFSRRILSVSKLAISQNRLQTIFDSTDDGMIVFDDNGIIESFNNSARKIFQFPESKSEKFRIQSLFKSDGTEAPPFESLFQTDDAEIGEKYQSIGVRLNGGNFPVELSIKRLDVSGKQQFICVVRDISERKQAESYLLDSTARITAIVDTVPDGIFTTDEAGIVQTMNPAAEKIFKLHVGEAVGINLQKLIPIIDEKMRENFLDSKKRKSIDYFGMNLQSFGLANKEYEFPIELSINLFQISGQDYFTIVVRDITEIIENGREIKRHRENLQELVSQATNEVKAIVQTAVNAVISIDQSGTINIFNPAAERIFGWKVDEVVGKNIATLIPGIDEKTHDGFLAQFIATRKSSIVGKSREVLALKKDGSLFPAHIAVGYSQLSADQHLFVAFIEDITTEKKARKELMMAKERAEQAAQSKANFLANMSHEIRTPMNAVIGFSEIVLQDKSLSPSSKEHINTILTSGRNLLGIINEILDFSKIEAGKVSLEVVCFHLTNFVKDTLRTLEFMATEHRLSLKVEFDPAIKNRVLGDPTRLRQVLLNIIGNAIKFTPSGTVTLTVSMEESTGLYLFNVKDTGIGMTPLQIKKVFSVFSQADTSTNRKFGGTGLGTAISKQIVELLGGSIWVESEVDKGSSFYFTVKLEPSEKTSECLFEHAPLYSPNYVSPRTFDILLAEDISVNATLATLRLERQGHKVTWAQNGKIALDAVKSGTFDVVLMDVQMPEMDGLEATRLIRNVDALQISRIPIIALTASIMEEDQQSCFNAGMTAVVGKPIDINKLLSTVETVVPQGQGKVNDYVSKVVESSGSIDFGPLVNFVDISSGLKAWKEPLVYARALANFAKERANDVDKLVEILEKKSPNFEEARAISHALKGVSGNLFLRQITTDINKVDSLLKNQDVKQALITLEMLDVSTKKLVDAIYRLSLPAEISADKKAFDKLEVKTVLLELLLSLEQLNPEAAEPFILELARSVSDRNLMGIKKSVENFDFELAHKEVNKLASILDISLEGGN